jgi:hypothetical protein
MAPHLLRTRNLGAGAAAPHRSFSPRATRHPIRHTAMPPSPQRTVHTPWRSICASCDFALARLLDTRYLAPAMPALLHSFPFRAPSRGPCAGNLVRLAHFRDLHELDVLCSRPPSARPMTQPRRRDPPRSNQAESSPIKLNQAQSSQIFFPRGSRFRILCSLRHPLHPLHASLRLRPIAVPTFRHSSAYVAHPRWRSRPCNLQLES